MEASIKLFEIVDHFIMSSSEPYSQEQAKYLYVSWHGGLLCSSTGLFLVPLLFQFLRAKVAVIERAFLDLVIFNNFLVHMLQEIDLFADERLETGRIELAPCSLLVPHEQIGVTVPVLKHLEAILRELMIQVTKY